MAVSTAVCLLLRLSSAWLPLIAFSVQLATELTSFAAPRTVLQAACASAAPTRATVVNLLKHDVLLV